ncbi:22394_t:CDS:2 [Entrophospora sp. SA101]|nr:16801_t:CDS:2 [Entrophospora sp. SA101]CAJ0919282.1 22394_t:CDS:2 [Entrophospora sp. SA101]
MSSDKIFSQLSDSLKNDDDGLNSRLAIELWTWSFDIKYG